MESQVPKLSTVIPFIDKSVKVIMELTQTTVSGETPISAIGLIEVVIGCTVASENPQGFSALIST